ncbi:MAG: hypothetical protein JSW59_03220 [Phycisphaerales bacterium]|nr:MAG: hypothetical protein JSW59_03220 [Phycisphaerales bacterium]
MNLIMFAKRDKTSFLLKAMFPFFSACVLAGCAVHPSLIHPSVNSADTAYAKMNLDLSRKILECVLAESSTTIDDRHSALERLAIQDWKFYKDYDSARTRLQDALRLGFKQSETWQTLSRIERESGHYRQARSAARSGIETAESESQKNASRLLFAQAVHDQLIENSREKKELDEKLLNEGHRMLTKVLDAEPGQPDASMFLLGISLLRRDGPTALKAWRFYFHIPSDQSATGVLERPGKTLDCLLPRWEGANLSLDELTRVALALGQSRMYEHAALVAAGVQAGPDFDCDPGIREILAYEDFIRNLKHITDEYYRQLAVGTAKGSLLWGLERSGREKVYQKTLMRKASDLWEQLPFADERPEFHFNGFQDEVRKRFGAEVLAGWSGNYRGYVLQMGHRVVDETIRVEQYGYKADLRSILLDMMVSSGYSSWFWDGELMIGGWAIGSTIAKVRRGGLVQAFDFLRKMTDPLEQDKEAELIEKDTALDESLAQDNPYAFLPGLARRLRLNAARRIYDSVKARGYEGDDLCVAFVAECVRLHTEHSIAHEGRHAIDRLHFSEEYGRWSAAEREFRAKLSQVAFASDPGFALLSIFIPNIGHSTSHGQADERIMKLIVEWMQAHTDEIAGIDTSRPMLPQFDLLSNDQIRSFFRGLDPLARQQRAECN